MWSTRRNGMQSGRLLWTLLILPVLIMLAYWPTLQFWFWADDFDLLRHARDLWTLKQLGSLVWKSHNNLFTPLSNLFFWLEFQIFGFDHSGYQSVSLLIHLVNTLLVVGIAYALGESRKLALLSGIVFSTAFPIQEAVSWVAAYVHLLSATFYFGCIIGCLLWVRSERPIFLVLSLIVFGLGALTKEDSVTVPFLMLLIVFWGFSKGKLGRKNVFISSALIGISGLIFLSGILWWHFGSSGAQMNAGAYRFGLHGIGNYRYLIGLLIPPPDYIPFVSLVTRLLPSQFMLVYSILAWSILGVLSISFVWVGIYGTALQRFAVLLILLAYAPFSMTTVGISLRYLYIPYAGFAILIADSILKLQSHLDTRWLTAGFTIFISANILAIWIWQFQMNENGRVRLAITQQLVSAYYRRDREVSSICINDLPDKYNDIRDAVRVFSTPPLPELIVNKEEDCPESALHFEFTAAGLSSYDIAD